MKGVAVVDSGLTLGIPGRMELSAVRCSCGPELLVCWFSCVLLLSAGFFLMKVWEVVS